MALLASVSAPAVGTQQQNTPTPAQLRAESNARSPFLVLEAPDGATLMGSGSRSGSGDHDEWYQRMETELSGVEALRFYARQLEAQGRALGPELVEGSVSLQTFRFQDDEGTSWHGLLYSSESVAVPGYVTVLLRQTRLTEE